MRVLFVASGNSKFGINPLVKSQGESLKKELIMLEYFPITGRGIKCYFKHISLLKNYLKNKKFDIIHAHYGLCGVVSQLARKKEKLVVSFMGDDLIGVINSKGKYSLTGRLYVTINKWYTRKKYDAVITKSQRLKDVLKDLCRVYLIPNGVDLDKYYPVDIAEARKRLNIPPKKKIILFVSDPARKEKNYPLAWAAVNLLHDPNIELLSLYNKTQQELNNFYNAADLLLLTSYHEGSPNVIKEAMACNLPIVSTDVGDVREILDNTTGCFISDYDPVEIAEKIKQTLSFSGRTTGRNRIIHLGLDINSIADKLISVYHDLLQ